MALKENSRKVFDYVIANDGQDFTAADIAAATGLEVRSVNGIVTSAFQRKGLMFREEAEILNAEGKHDKVKFVRLTDTGRAFDPDAEPEKKDKE